MDKYGVWSRVLLAGFALAILAPFLSGQSVETATIMVGGEHFRVELATTEADKRQGLMHRKRFPPGTGMLFVYNRPRPVSFWNKDVLFPIDILFFDQNNALIRTDTHVPPCPNPECPRYRVGDPVKYVLELPAGTADRLELRSGNRLQFL